MVVLFGVVVVSFGVVVVSFGVVVVLFGVVVMSLGGGGMVVEWLGGRCRVDWWWCRLRVVGV